MAVGKPDPPRTSKKAWTKVDQTKSLELTASKLTEGTEYVFRVAAQNAVGVGDFVELQKGVVPKGQFGECIYSSTTNNLYQRTPLHL